MTSESFIYPYHFNTSFFPIAIIATWLFFYFVGSGKTVELSTGCLFFYKHADYHLYVLNHHHLNAFTPLTHCLRYVCLTPTKLPHASSGAQY